MEFYKEQLYFVAADGEVGSKTLLYVYTYKHSLHMLLDKTN